MLRSSKTLELPFGVAPGRSTKIGHKSRAPTLIDFWIGLFSQPDCSRDATHVSNRAWNRVLNRLLSRDFCRE